MILQKQKTALSVFVYAFAVLFLSGCDDKEDATTSLVEGLLINGKSAYQVVPKNVGIMRVKNVVATQNAMAIQSSAASPSENTFIAIDGGDGQTLLIEVANLGAPGTYSLSPISNTFQFITNTGIFFVQSECTLTITQIEPTFQGSVNNCDVATINPPDQSAIPVQTLSINVVFDYSGNIETTNVETQNSDTHLLPTIAASKVSAQSYDENLCAYDKYAFAMAVNYYLQAQHYYSVASNVSWWYWFLKWYYLSLAAGAYTQFQHWQTEWVTYQSFCQQ